MIVYHRTPAGGEILRDGFRDGQGTYGLTPGLVGGVFVSNLPADVNEGAKGDDLLRIEVPADLISEYEIIDAGGHSALREWCVPAVVLNGQDVTIRMVADEDSELDAPNIQAILDPLKDQP